MNRFWKTILLPIIEKIKAKHIVEIGCDTGKNTINILEYCSKNNAKLSAIDPVPKFDVKSWKLKYGPLFNFYQELSLNALPLIKNYDVVLIDGDHNWYTVYNELKIIEKTCKDNSFPIIFLHDIGWPYGRRDLYYNPENIPLAYRQPYKKLGILPNQSSLTNEGGLNKYLYNSIYENNLKNGVLTAIEDFISERDGELYFEKVDAFHGLGIIVNERNKWVFDIIRNNYKQILQSLEQERVSGIIINDRLKDKITNLEEEIRLTVKKYEDKILQMNHLLEGKEQLLEDKKELIIKMRDLEKAKEKLSNELKSSEGYKEGLTNKLKELEDNKEELLNKLKKLEDNNKNLINRINLLEDEKNYLENRIKELNMSKDYLELKISNLNNEISDLVRAKKQLEVEKEQQIKKLKDKIEKLEKELIRKNESLIRAEIAANTHLNSIRYRLGDALILALKPSKHTILAPFKIIRLFCEGLQKVKNRKKLKVTKPKISQEVRASEPNEKDYTPDKSKEQENNFNEKNINKFYNQIISINKKYIDDTLPDNTPLVSIIMLNRNGAHHLKRFFKSFKENTIYPNYEIIIVDNDSTDNSISILESQSQELPITIIKNTTNKSFSEANNQAVKYAKGEYLLLTNNDVEPTYGWLNELVKCEQRTKNAGAIGAKLIYPYCPESSINSHKSFKIQHMGIAFKEEKDFIRPYNMGNGYDPFDSRSNKETVRAAITAAVLLVKKELYFEVKGLDEEYIYGYEDVDFSLKLTKRGYKNIYCPTALLFHYEFGTQSKDNRKAIQKRRLNNMRIFKNKWYKWLQKQIMNDKLNNNKIFTEDTLKVAFAVTESGPNVSAGDYFTALDLGEAMKSLGWEIYFLNRKGPGDWYEVGEHIDIVISMLDVYDPRKIKNAKNSLIKIGWARNWFDRWVSSPGFDRYDLAFASSKIACDFMQEKSGKEVILLPIATNPDRFNEKVKGIDQYKCDYCFTGSYWNDPREIIKLLDPQKLPFRFNMYGKNWDRIEKFKPFHKGFIDYSKMPILYNSTKIVLDDANRVTKPYGSVNSRVFDALATGTLVLTNGELGSNATFDGKLPVYRTKEELENLLNYYLLNDEARKEKVKELKEFVLNNHTYYHRANRIKEVLESKINKRKVAIKVPAPKWETVYEWGDYHFALAMKKQFERKNWEVLIQILPEWDNMDDSDYDAVIVLRGLSRYIPKGHHFNIMWNISHPDKVKIEEYNEYDYVFVASKIWAEHLAQLCDVEVEPMLQCTDPDLFHPNETNNEKYELLFVGNSRKVFRKIIKDLLPTDKDLSVYGTHWNKFIDKKYIKGEHIPNKELSKAYSSCKILLNDHWDDMREKGFISNRIFDGFASGAFIISDKIQGAEEVFGDCIVMYESKEELKELIDKYLNNENLRKDKAKKGCEIVKKGHTFEKRVDRFIEIISKTKN